MGEDKQPRRWRKWCAIGSALVLMLVVYANRPKGELPPLPVPNGYDDFLKAASLLKNPLDYGDILSYEIERKKELVIENREVLELIDQGLKKEVGVPDLSSEQIFRMIGFYFWWQLLVIDSELKDGGIGVNGFIKSLRLGTSMQNNGASLDVLRGTTIEVGVLEALEKRIPFCGESDLKHLKTNLKSLRVQGRDPQQAADIDEIRFADDPIDVSSSSSLAWRYKDVTDEGISIGVVEEVNQKSSVAYDSVLLAIDARLETLEKSGALDQ